MSNQVQIILRHLCCQFCSPRVTILMMQKKWFLLILNQVTGPFTEDEVTDRLRADPQALIWGQGMAEWLDSYEWKKKLLLLHKQKNPQGQDSHLLWWIKVVNHTTGPLTYQSLIQTLQLQPSLANLQIRQDPDHQWKSLFDFPILIDQVGSTRRLHPRAPLNGIFKFVRNKIDFEALVTSISEGGLGVVDAPFLVAGDSLAGVIESPLLPSEIHCELEVLSQRGDGACGLKFKNISFENSSLIISYLKKFALENESLE